MGYDAMANDAAVPASAPRDIGKKKRANRSAKLKQCKLDARREQWLSQVKNKGGKDAALGTSPTSPPPCHPSMTGQCISDGRSVERERRGRDGSSFSQDGSDMESPTHYDPPTSGGGNASRKNRPANNSISSSGSSIGSCSRSVSDAEEEGEENGGGGLDDWEAVADALTVSADNDRDHPKSNQEVAGMANRSVTEPSRTHTKPEPNRTIPRAWRPDDQFRPQSLPNLSKQRSFPVNMERHYGAAGWASHRHQGILSPPPSSCPICYEDLDLTDSSFLPCSCGFRLCLFCHKRILEADGRCPGCRKQYDPMMHGSGEEIGVCVVPLLPYRLSRSCSMSSRS